jgi:hypothetical protein
MHVGSAQFLSRVVSAKWKNGSNQDGIQQLADKLNKKAGLDAAMEKAPILRA